VAIPRNRIRAVEPVPQRRRFAQQIASSPVGRVDDPGPRTVDTVAGSLPVSPLMDPAFIDARSKWLTPKPRRCAYKKTAWQKKLARNPMGTCPTSSAELPVSIANLNSAHALATPVRLCPVSRVQLPSYFLQGFNLVRHSTSGGTWLVPYDLAAPRVEQSASAAALDWLPSSSAPDLSPGKPLGGTAYILSRQALLSGFTRDSSPYKNAHRKLFRLTSSSRLDPALGGAIWREDMATWIPELMRRRIVEDLIRLSNLYEVEDEVYLTRCSVMDDMKALHHRGCGLFVGPGGLAAGDAEPARIPPPSRMSVLRVEGSRLDRTLIIYNLDSLLGPAHVAELRRSSLLFAGGSFFLLGQKRSIELQGRLWKLAGYLARNLDDG